MVRAIFIAAFFCFCLPLAARADCCIESKGPNFETPDPYKVSETDLASPNGLAAAMLPPTANNAADAWPPIVLTAIAFLLVLGIIITRARLRSASSASPNYVDQSELRPCPSLPGEDEADERRAA